MHCNDFLNAYVLIGGVCFAVGFLHLETLRNPFARLYFNSYLLPSYNSDNHIATITQYCTNFFGAISVDVALRQDG